MRIAIVHDWLVTYGGAERVLEQMLAVFPQADLFSLIDFLPPEQSGFLGDRKVHTSFLQKLPLARRFYRHYLPLMPMAVEQFDLSSYDLVISSSHTVAKGVLTGPDQLHFCMCYTPVRYAWDLQHQYLKETGLERGLRSWCVRRLLHQLRLWDYRTAAGVDGFIAISQHIARRIRKVYRRGSTVIYPPVDVHKFTPGQDKGDYYLTVSRIVPYKKIGLIVEAFSRMPDKQLVVIGDGPELKKIKKKAGPNVTILGFRPFEEVLMHMRRAKAFVFAALEDFGIVLLEAQACGVPVIAYGRGGAMETIREQASSSPTGYLYMRQEAEAIIEAVKTFESEALQFDAAACRENALRFSPERFREELLNYVTRQLKKHHLLKEMITIMKPGNEEIGGV